MKRNFMLICLFAILAYSVFAEKITVLAYADIPFGNEGSLFKNTVAMFKKYYPNIEVEFLSVDQQGGSTITMDSLLASGDAPNIYFDSQVRTGKYLVPEYALDLKTYIHDLNKYDQEVLTPFIKKGRLLGLPAPGSSQGMFVNLDVMKEVGYTVPENWTISDFLKMAELIKQKYNGKKFATGMFAANQSGDYLLNNWFASFGVSFYQNGDYNNPVMANTGGAKVFEFYQTLMKNGYIHPNSANLTDDDYIMQWMKGEIVATAFFPTWCKAYFDSALSQGLIKKIPEYKIVSFPRAPGVDKVPTYTNSYGIVVHKTGTKLDEISARFVEYFNSASNQEFQAKYQNNTPNRIDAKYNPTDVGIIAVDKLVKENGVMDVGLSDPRFPERRALQYPILQKVLNFKITPEKAIIEYQNAMKKVK
jgi:ABC-type glycerol-3-phosphate transport system substrate-binding protein